MSAPAKKAPAKRAAAKRSPRAAKPTEPEAPDPADEDPADDGPIIIGKRRRDSDAPVEMETIFILKGVEYQIPKNPSAALVLSWFLDRQKAGAAAANANMGIELLGEESLRALAAAPEVEPEDLYKVFEKIGKVFFDSENFRKIMEAPDPS